MEVESGDVESGLGRPATGGELGVVPTLDERGSEDAGFDDEGAMGGVASGTDCTELAGGDVGEGDDRDGGEAVGDGAEAWVSAAPDERIVGAWVSSGGN